MARDTPVVVVGSGPLARVVASRLGHPASRAVVVLEPIDHECGAGRSPEIAEAIRGVVYDPETLRRAGVGPGTQLVVLTDNDDVNFLVATVAQRMLGVTHALVAVGDPQRGGLWEEFEIETLSPLELAADAILGRVRGQGGP